MCFSDSPTCSPDPFATSKRPAGHFERILQNRNGPGSSVGIASELGLDGPGSSPGWDEIFRPSRPALAPTQPPVIWVQGLSRG